MKRSPVSNLALCLALLASAMLTARGVHASDHHFTVNTLADQPDADADDGQCITSTGVCSLRAAVMQGNHFSSPGATTVTLPPGTYLLNPPTGTDGEDSGDLNFTAPLSFGQRIDIEGAGAESTIIDANYQDRVITVATDRSATVSGITIRHGNRQGAGANAFGGGLFISGQVVIYYCVIEDNHATRDGGGIYTELLAQLQIVGSSFRSNVAGHAGGGMSVLGYTRIAESTLYDNTASDGGGIANGITGELYVVNSTISNNYAYNNGGGISNLYGGGEFNQYGRTYLYSTSVVGNDADHDHDQDGGIGGGVYNATGAQFQVVNTLIAGNTSAVFADDDCRAVLEAYGWNLLGDLAGCAFTGNGIASRSTVSVNTLGLLQDNGGPSMTHALLAGSEAIDSTLVQGCIDDFGSPLTTDQRGAARVAGARCDVGAFEYGAIVPVSDRIFRDGFEGGM